ncbi:MAG: OmpA family protein [Rubrivivax sp.]|nr:OmpA family protein [Rubrivivax sp.]
MIARSAASPKHGAATTPVLAVLAAALVLAACASPPETPSPAAVATAAPRPDPAPAPAAAPPSAQPGGVTSAPGADGRNLGAASQVATVSVPAPDSVYFEFDESALGAQDTPVIERFGKYLAAARGAGLRVEGHCDERGSREYNLALGQRRAQAVVDALRTFGIDTARIEAVSFGEERPRAVGRDEASWAQNRRADLRAKAAP